MLLFHGVSLWRSCKSRVHLSAHWLASVKWEAPPFRAGRMSISLRLPDGRALESIQDQNRVVTGADGCRIGQRRLFQHGRSLRLGNLIGRSAPGDQKLD